MKQEMDTNADIFLPVNGRKEIEVYENNFRFILVANNPGSVLLVKTVSSESITRSIVKLPLKIWPLLVIVVSMGSICGILLWIVVIYNIITVSIVSVALLDIVCLTTYLARTSIFLSYPLVL